MEAPDPRLERLRGWGLFLGTGKARILSVVIGTILGIATIGFARVRPRSSSEEVQQGAFEERAGKVEVLLDGARPDDNMDVLDGDHHFMGAGGVGGFALRANETIRITEASASPIPYIVVGADEPVPERPGAVTRFKGGRRVVASGRGLALEPWSEPPPYRMDADIADALERACAPTGDRTVVVRREGDGLFVTVGACGGRFETGVTSGQPVSLLVVASTGSYYVSKDGGFLHEKGVRFGGLVFIALVALVQSALLTFLARPVGAVGVLATAFAAKFLAGPILVLVALWLFILALAGLRGLAASWRFLRVHPVAGTSLAAVTLAGVAALAFHFASKPNEANTQSIQFDERGAHPNCLLIGYSVSLNHSLLPGTPGMLEDLASQCPVCRGGAQRRARNGGLLPLLRDVACLDVPKPREMVFYGGANDDFIYSAYRQGRMQTIRRMASAVVNPPASRSPFVASMALAVWRAAAEQSLEFIGEQTDLIKEAIGCAQRNNGGNLWFAHDFLVTDLDPALSREGARAEMLRRRRAAVDAAGGHFIDVLEASRETVSVAWFNDVMHLSSVGHRHVAELVCADMQKHEPLESAVTR